MKNFLNPMFRHMLLCLLVCSCCSSSIFAQSHPGGVSGAVMWLKGNQGVTTSGSNVTGWTNQSGPVNFTGKGNPQLGNAQVNFQPAIIFNGTNSITSTSNLLTNNVAYTKFVVFKFDGTNTNNLVSSGIRGGAAIYASNTTTDLHIFHSGKILSASNVVNTSRFYMATAGFNSGVAAGTYISVDGASKASMNSSAGHITSTMQLGSYNDGNNLTGRIAEAIVYPTAMSSTANTTRQVQTYLAVKYGITAAHNYLASNGAVIYNAGSFANNIAGLGRDDNSSLYQKQGRNIDEGHQVLMSIGTIANTNDANGGTIAADRQFLIWGDNNGAFNSTAAITGWTGVTNRLSRIWKLQNTGSFSQQVTVYIPTAALTALPGSNPYLVYNTSNLLNGGGTMVAPSATTIIGGVPHTAYTLTFPTTGTLYFSFAAKTVSPGSVAGAVVWLRADAGMSASGNNILNWTNQMNAAVSFNATNNPQLSSSDINFNPGIRFFGNNYFTSTGNTLTGNSPYTKFVVFKYDGNSGNNLVSSPAGGSNALYGASTTTGVYLWHSGTFLSAANSVTANRYYMATGGFTRNLTGGSYINIDGANTITGTSSSAYVTSGTQLGAHNAAGTLNGRIAEVIIYPSSLGNNTVNTRKIQTYLGLKYGISVKHDYISSNGTLTFPIAGFGNNIAGIGRDDSTALYQKQGRSINTDALQVLMAANTYAASNQANNSVIPTNHQFLIWGDNGAVLNTSSIAGWSTVNTRLNKIWRLRNTGSFNQQVTVYFPAAGLINLPGTNPYLIFNTSTTLAGGGTEVPFSATTTIDGVVHKGFTVTFPAGTSELYFSFAAKTIQPANVNGAAVWLRPDAGLNTSGTTVTGWVNQVNANNSFSNNTGTPQFEKANLNFHPGVTFNGTSSLVSTGIVTPANSPYTKFVVFKYDGGSTSNNIISAGNSGNSAFWGSTTSTNLALWHSSTILTASNVVDDSRYYLATGGFSSGAANGTFINVNGTNRAQMTSSAAYTASDLQLGAYGSGNNLVGRVAEVIVYPSALGSGTVSTRKVQSYLGVKYGITMGHNYLASDGSTITYDNSTHAANIAAIGRDDDAGLNQLQGRSNNTSAEQITIALGAVAASNDENPNSFASDKQFLVWGDDNASITSTMPLTGYTNVNNRFARVWKLQNTGSFNQQVIVYIPTAALNGLTNTTKYLIYNTSAMLTGPGTEVVASRTSNIGGIPHTGFRLTFPTTGTLYFSFASYAVHPGAVNGAAVWLRSDAGVNLTGSNVASWVNQRNTANNFTATGTVQYSPAAVNFNPTMIYNGSGYLSSAANVTTVNTGNYTKFVVFRSAEGTGARNLMSAYSGNPGTAMYTQNNAFNMRNAGTINATANYSLNTGKQYLGTQLFNRGVTNGSLMRIDGVTNLSVTDNSTHSVDRLHIGAFNNSNFISAGSNIAEAIMYNAALTATEYGRVESYLALKYGITLSSNYLNTNTAVVYNVSGYPNHIAGIGQDANTGLNQRQSKSSDPGNQVVMALGNIAESNEANTSSFDADVQYLVWGDNDGPGYLFNQGISQKRLTRTWKLMNSGSFNQAVTVYYPVAGLNGLGETPSLLYGSLSSMDDGSATRISAGSTIQIGGEAYRSFQLSFPVEGTLYFSFAGLITPEICGNGIDDDLDGYIDNLDSDCSPVPPCTAPAPALTNFSITQEWVTTPANNLAASVSPTVADLDGDGIPEVLAVRAGGTGITVFKGDGSNASKNSIDYNIQLPVRVQQSTMQAAVADIDRDGKPEVVVVGGDAYVYVFNNISGSTTNYKFKSADTVTTQFRNGSPRIADIDEDGTPEIIVGLDVFQFDFAKGILVKAVTGSASPHGRTGRASEWGCDIVVVDIIPNNPGKEIVAGSKVYGVNINTGTISVLADLSIIAGTSMIPYNSDGPTAVADLDLDGQLDITYPTGTHLVIWDPVAGIMKMCAPYDNNGTVIARGMPTIANVFNERAINGATTDLPEVLFNCDYNMHCFNLNKPAASVWSLATTDGSGETGVTAFDLNGDGILEIVYNDETHIRVINGNSLTPANIATYPSGTATWMEHPVVVDVDNDGSAEFVCVSGANTAFTGNLRVFGATAGTTVWQNTRKVWNGRGYRARGINDDLTIPVKEQNILVEYPVGTGRYPLNIYNGQADERSLDPGIVATADLAVSDLEVLNSETVCEFTPSAARLTFSVSNNGSAAAAAGEPLRFYLGDPRKAGAVRLPVTSSLRSNLGVGGSVQDTVTLDLSSYTAPYSIYIVTNDNGSGTIPFTLPLSNINSPECDYDNNIDSIVLSPVDADLGNLPGTYPSASASIRSEHAAWLGTNAPDAECTPDENDDADGLVMTSGSNSGNGSKNAPWVVKGIDVECKFTVTVNGSGDPKPVHWAAWYDADGNGSFTDDLDIFINGELMHGSPVSTDFSFIVPPAMGATNGAIRVIAAAVDPGFSKEMNGTGNFVNGEVEDFYIVYAWPLPVTLTDFTAVPTANCSVQLKWNTSMEQSSSHFNIEVYDGKSFITLATVPSRNMITGASYSFVHNITQQGDINYRLKHFDVDGKFQYSRVVTAKATCSDVAIRLLPNPVTETGAISGLQSGDRILIYNADGKLAMEQIATGFQSVINMKKLPAGVYMAQIIRNGTAMTIIKVVKK